MSHSILRRYTPPTCTLEILAKNSPLSRWVGQPVLKHLRFQLSLDDPKLPKEEWIVLRGDRVQLEALHEAVSNYVQHFLEQSYDLDTMHRFHSYVSTTSAAEGAVAVLPTATQDELRAIAASPPNAISLQPSGLLTHTLALGSLATPDTANKVSLSALQLFDLANALDEYASELVALPDVQRSRQLAPSSLRWGQLAATGLLVVGLSASVAKIIESSSRPASPTASQGDSSDQNIAMQVPPTAIQSPIPPITSGQKLPSPPPIGSTVPASPGLPTFPVAAPLPRISSADTPAGAVTLTPNTRSAQSKETGNQITVSPSTSQPSATAPTQPAQPMPKPLALNREFAKTSPSQSASESTLRAATGDQGAPAEQMDTAFDTIPQIAEARQYFQQRWTPPQGLTQTLEYTLLVNADGSIQRIVPLGQAAGNYIDRTGGPLAGEPFVSAISGGRNAKVRLVLSPDGSVKTFLEGFY
ncbi:DUF4335 domain-containing protein [Leptolyngbya sp. FACHB-321]|uniref:DUF4335 domain-containing protein n=1 Tax=Leptolyngbya sp. FACHB-321 TaxID=2692807 RepID=UPI001688C684|nr:DUF4335 domain-containing protein [Leptolyngbya sp. FACHB-321]MBD2037171.1 DUF4335 domain-containing protein [Leptolyngbya sp. FACHB-321]